MPLGYLAPLVISRLYSAEQMGTYAIAINLVSILALICRFGMDMGLMRYVASLPSEKKSACLRQLFFPTLLILLSISSVGGIVVYTLGNCLEQGFHAPSLKAMLPAIALALPLSVATAVCGEALRSINKVRWVVFQYNVVTPAAFLILVSAFGIWGIDPAIGPIVLGWSFLAGTLFGLVYLLAGLNPILRSGKICSAEYSIADLAQYSFPLFLSSLLTVAFAYLDTLIIGWFATPEKVAFYVAAVKTSALVSFPLLIFDAVVTPLFAQLHGSGDLRRLENVAQSTSNWMYYVSLPITVLSLILAPNLMNAFGEGFEQAASALRIIVFAQIVNVATGSVGFILLMTGHQWIHVFIKTITGILAVPFMAYAVSSNGITGLAFAKGSWLVILNVTMSIAVWRTMKIKAFANQMRVANIGALLGIALYISAVAHLNKFWGIGLFSFCYCAFIMRIFFGELKKLNTI